MNMKKIVVALMMACSVSFAVGIFDALDTNVWYFGDGYGGDAINTEDSITDFPLFLTNLAYRIGSTNMILNAPATEPTFTRADESNDMARLFWYGERVLLYNGIYTQDVNNSVHSYSNYLPRLEHLLFDVDAGYFRLSYKTFSQANPYTDIPAIRLGAIASTVMTNPVLVLGGFSDATNDAILVVKRTPFMTMSLTSTTYFSAFPASLVEYDHDNGTNYQVIAEGLAGYGFGDADMCEIVLVTNGVTSYRSKSLVDYLSLDGTAQRPWWFYARGADFVCFTNQVEGTYTNYAGKDVVNYIGQ